MRRDRKRIDLDGGLEEKCREQRLAELAEAEAGHVAANGA